MAVTLNASTASGLIATSDTSGIIQLQSNGSTKATISSSGFSYPGGVLQVVQTVKTDALTSTTTSFADITGMSVSITPSSASNKVLVLVKAAVGAQSGTNRAGVRLVRGSTAIFIGDTAGSRTSVTSVSTAPNSDAIDDLVFVFLDSPATTSSTTYKVQWTTTGAGTIAFNRSVNDSDSAANYRPASSITVMEIAA